MEKKDGNSSIFRRKVRWVLGKSRRKLTGQKPEIVGPSLAKKRVDQKQKVHGAPAAPPRPPPAPIQYFIVLSCSLVGWEHGAHEPPRRRENVLVRSWRLVGGSGSRESTLPRRRLGSSRAHSLLAKTRKRKEKKKKKKKQKKKTDDENGWGGAERLKRPWGKKPPPLFWRP